MKKDLKEKSGSESARKEKIFSDNDIRVNKIKNPDLKIAVK